MGEEASNQRDAGQRFEALGAMNAATDVGAMPAKVSVMDRPIVTAGFANEVDDVHQYAAPIQAPTAAGVYRARPVMAKAKITITRPAVATSSDVSKAAPPRTCVDRVVGSSNMTLAKTAPARSNKY